MKRLLLILAFNVLGILSIKAQCTADFGFFTNGLTVTFVDSSTYSPNVVAPLQQDWNFGDGLTGTGTNPSHTYASAGTYSVYLTIYDSIWTCYDTIRKNVTVNTCTANFSYQVNNDSLFIQNLSDSTLFTSYNFGDNNFSTQSSPIHIYAQSGTYVVCQTVTDSANCFATFCDTIQINIAPPCQAGFTYNINSYTLDIVNTASNYTSILYDFGDGSSTSNPNPTHIFAANGAYIVCQTVRNSLGCFDQKCDTVIINVAPPCQAGFSYQSNFTQVDFSNQAVNFTFILYEFGDGDSSASINPTHNYLNPGTYIVTQTVRNPNNCTSTFTDTITISAPLPCIADFNYTSVVDTTIFTSTSSNYSRLIFYFGDGDSSALPNPSHIYSSSGNYTVQLIVFNDSTNCVDSISKTIAVTVSQSCVAKFNLALDTNQRQTLFLVNTSSSDNSHHYFWDFGDGNSSNIRLPNHTYAENKAYNICLTVFDTVQSCTSTYCDSVGLDSNGNILKSAGFSLKVLNGSFIGIEEESLENKVSIYPNPFYNRFTIETTHDATEVDYQIINLSGILISQGQINTRVKQIEIVNSPPGIYFLKLMYKGKLTVKRIVKI